MLFSQESSSFSSLQSWTRCVLIFMLSFLSFFRPPSSCPFVSWKAGREMAHVTWGPQMKIPRNYCIFIKYKMNTVFLTNTKIVSVSNTKYSPRAAAFKMYESEVDHSGNETRILIGCLSSTFLTLAVLSSVWWCDQNYDVSNHDMGGCGTKYCWFLMNIFQVIA